jgi:hypothetical protein
MGKRAFVPRRRDLAPIVSRTYNDPISTIDRLGQAAADLAWIGAHQLMLGYNPCVKFAARLGLT